MMSVPDPNTQEALPTTQGSITSKGVPEGFLSGKFPSVIMKRIHFQHAVQKGACGSSSQRISLLGSSRTRSGFCAEERAQECYNQDSFLGGNLGSHSLSSLLFCWYSVGTDLPFDTFPS